MSFYTKGISASNMVLLQNSINCVYGIAPAGKRISMTFRNQAFETVSDNEGNWKFEFNAGVPCTGETLVLYCEGESHNICFENVAVGEVWLCSGQSNMQLTMERLKYTYPQEMTAPENQNIRMITVPVVFDFEGPKETVDSPVWKVAGPETMASLSGTAYFFAKKLQKDLGIPVGIINASQGGTPVTAWMNAEYMEGIGNYVQRLEELKKPGYVKTVQFDEKQAQDAWYEKLNLLDPGIVENWEKLTVSQAEEQGWGTCEIPGQIDLIEKGGIVWFKKEIELSAEEAAYFEEKGARLWLGVIRDADAAYINGVQVGVTYYVYPPRRYEVPKGLLKAGKNTVTLRVQQNLHNRKMFFWPEKQYALASMDAKVIPSAIRNIEKAEGRNTDGSGSFGEGIYLPLDGEWLCCGTSQIEDVPPTTFFEYEPSALFNAMLAPCFKTAVRGALWYQGESNAEKYAEYKELLCRMITLWREEFVYCPEEKMPFVVMQLPNWADDTLPDSYPVFSDWALLREAQAEAVMASENTVLSVAIDAGEWNDLHPEKKLTGGTRSAEQALRLVYNKDYGKPAFMTDAEKEGDAYIVRFETEKDLSAYSLENGSACFDSPATKVRGFALLSKNLVGTEAVEMCHAEILPDKKSVKVSIPPLPIGHKAVELRYLWANCPECVNLYAGTLPVVPGRIALD